MPQSYPAPDPTNMWSYVGVLNTRTDTLRSNFSGNDAPGAPEPGQNWFDDDDLVMYYFDGSGWVPYGTSLQSDFDLQFNTALNFRVENTGATPTASAGTVGQIVLHQGAAKLKVVVSDTVVENVVSVSNASLQPVPLPLLSWQKDSGNPPVDAEVGVTPTWPTWQFSNTSQRMHRATRLPEGFSGDAAVLLRLHVLLGAVEAPADTINVVVDYEKATPGSSDAAGGDSSQVTAAVSVGANVGQYTYHRVDVLLPFADVDNPLAKNDALALSVGASALGGAGQVSEFLIYDAELLSPCGEPGLTEVA